MQGLALPFSSNPTLFTTHLLMADIVSSKDLLQNIPANDGTERNLYQTTVNDFINASPVNEEIYKETFPISAALPDVAQTLATAAVPGLGLIPNVEESFNELCFEDYDC